MKPRWNTGLLVALAVGSLFLSVAVDLLVHGGTSPGRIRRPSSPGLSVGTTAPDFQLKDRSERPQRLSELVRGDTVLCFTCGCANCLDLQTYLGILHRRMGSRAPHVITVTTMPQDREDAWRRDTRLPQTILYEPQRGHVMDDYHGHPCPRVYRLTAERRIAWVSPSPHDVLSMREVGNAMAANLGFPAYEPPPGTGGATP